MKKWIIIIILLAVVLFFILVPDEQELGDGYYYLSKIEAIDVGYSEAIIYKSSGKYLYQDIKIGGDVFKVCHNRIFILAVQKPITLEVEEEPFDSNTIASLKYYIITKKSGKVYGPYKKYEYIQECKKLGVPNELNLDK